MTEFLEKFLFEIRENHGSFLKRIARNSIVAVRKLTNELFNFSISSITRDKGLHKTKLTCDSYETSNNASTGPKRKYKRR